MNVKKINNKKLLKLNSEGYTLRHMSEILGIDHHRVKRQLSRLGVEYTNKKTKKKKTEEMKKRIGDMHRGNKYCVGKKTSELTKYKNMRGHLKYDVSIDWLLQFTDLKKLQFLNKSITRTRDRSLIDDNMYKMFIEKFYYDEKFNFLYTEWTKTGNKYIKPSLDHVVPSSKGGKGIILNFQFISWLENRAKNDTDYGEWQEIKQNINYYF